MRGILGYQNEFLPVLNRMQERQTITLLLQQLITVIVYPIKISYGQLNAHKTKAIALQTPNIIISTTDRYKHQP